MDTNIFDTSNYTNTIRRKQLDTYNWTHKNTHTHTHTATEIYLDT